MRYDFNALLATISLTVFVQAVDSMRANAYDKGALPDIIVTIEGAARGGNNGILVALEEGARMKNNGGAKAGITTITVKVGDGAAAEMNPPAGVPGTGISRNPAGAATPVPAPSQAAVPSPGIGAPGQLVGGIGKINPAGACDCSCQCAPGAFPYSPAMAASQASIAPTTLQPVASSPSMSAASSDPTANVESNPTTTISNADPAAQSTDAGSSVSNSSSISPTSASASSTSASTAGSSTSVAATPASQLQFPLNTTTSSGIQATAAADRLPDPGPIDISTFSLLSSLGLGNLARPTIQARR